MLVFLGSRVSGPEINNPEHTEYIQKGNDLIGVFLVVFCVVICVAFLGAYLENKFKLIK